jgi:hypothetical protein
MDQGQQINNLIEVSEIVKASGRRELASWFDDALQQYLVDDEPLEKAFLLHSEGGKPKARTIWQRHRRNMALRAAFQQIEGKNTFQRVTKLQRHIADFEARIWPRYLEHETAPAEWSNLRKHLFAALQTGVSIPSSLSAMYEVLEV